MEICATNGVLKELIGSGFNQGKMVKKVHGASAVNPLNEKNLTMRNSQKVAARLGLEPRQNESESFVLPLHHQAVDFEELDWGSLSRARQRQKRD